MKHLKNMLQLSVMNTTWISYGKLHDNQLMNSA